MLRVGLTGGLASGKSFIGRELEKLGCLVIRADELGHQVIEPGAEAYDAVVREFGRDILNADASIDRRRLAAEVFGNPARLETLNALIHPPVKKRTRKLLEAFAAREPHGIAISEAAILIETGTYRDCARLILAVCREEQQIERAMARDSLTREEVLKRMSRQMPLAEKVKYADYIVDTSGSKEHAIEQTRAIYESLKNDSRRKESLRKLSL